MHQVQFTTNKSELQYAIPLAQMVNTFRHQYLSFAKPAHQLALLAQWSLITAQQPVVLLIFTISTMHV